MRTESPAPVRPSLPPLFWFAFAVWAGIVAAEGVSWRVFCGDVEAWCAIAIPIIATSVLAVCLRGRCALCVLVAAGVASGSVCGGLYWTAWRSDCDAIASRRSLVTVFAPGDAVGGRFGEHFSARLVGSGARVRVTCPDGIVPLELGQTGDVEGTVSPTLPNERGRDAHRCGQVACVTATELMAVRWTAGVRGVIGRARQEAGRRLAAVPGGAGALVAGVTLGDRRRMQGTEAEADFRTTGLSHLVAVSGSHLVVVAGVFAWALQRTRLRHSACAMLLLAVMVAYVLATGVQASAVRAVLMSGAVVLVGSLGRRVDRLATLSTGVVVALIVSPPVAFDAGFQLSVCSVLGLVVYARIASAWAEVVLPRFLIVFAEPLSLTVIAQIATLPVAVPLFGVVSLVAPVANLLVGPLVTVVLLAGLLGLAVGPLAPGVGDFLVMAAGSAAALSVDIAAGLAELPNAAVPVTAPAHVVVAAVLLPLAGLWAVWPRPSAVAGRLAAIACLGLAMVAAAGQRPSTDTEVVVMDVGQGDAIVVRDGQETALIDTGPSPEPLRRALVRAGVRRIGVLLLSHRHEDHIGGLDALRPYPDITTALVPACGDGWVATATDSAAVAPAGLAQVIAGDRVRIGDTWLTVYWPRKEVSDPAQNESSLVVLVERSGRRVLLTGDAEAAQLERVASQIGDVDVVKVGHHGSKGSLSTSLLRTLRPEIAAISVGEGNRFGHPAEETLDLLDDAGCSVMRTDEDGDLHFPLVKNGETALWRGASMSERCAKLRPHTPLLPNGTHERSARRTEARIPDSERSEDAGRAGREQAAKASGRGSRPRLQLHDVRRRESERRRSDRLMQHAPVHERSPPGHRSWCGEAQQGGAG